MTFESTYWFIYVFFFYFTIFTRAFSQATHSNPVQIIKPRFHFESNFLFEQKPTMFMAAL